MKFVNVMIITIVSILLCSCEMPQVLRPLRLYDLSDGTTIEVFLKRNSPNSGRLVSAQVQDERFDGEMIFYGNTTEYRPPIGFRHETDAVSSQEHTSTEASFAELYGFGKDANVRPAGTAMLVGNHGTTIEIVLYRISADLQYGDGVARDNKGRRYRVFLSVEG